MPTTHGKSKTPVWNCWRNMKDRCLNKNNPKYKDYGGRDIKVSKRWLKFENFYKDMGDPPSNEHTLHRINNNGHYCKSNCKWALADEQANCKRNNIDVTILGETKTTAQWAKDKRCVVSAARFYVRIKNGMDPILALTTPVEITITAFGETKTVREWCNDSRCKAHPQLLRVRLRRGMEPEKAIVEPPFVGFNFTAFGETKNMKNWSEDPRCEVCLDTLNKRLKQNIPLEKAIKKNVE